MCILDPPNVYVTPLSFVVNQTQPATFTCTSYGIPLPNLTWYDNSDPSRPLPVNESTVYMNETGFELIESILMFSEALRTDMSTYTCVAVNGIPNLLSTPENGTITLYVQGQYMIIINKICIIWPK